LFVGRLVGWLRQAAEAGLQKNPDKGNDTSATEQGA
jgi:hypothetical protein